MSKFIFILLAVIHGAVCSSVNASVDSWQYWVLLGCVCGTYICGLLDE